MTNTEIINSVKCSICGAEKGEACRYSPLRPLYGDGTTSVIHASRWLVAEETASILERQEQS